MIELISEEIDNLVLEHKNCPINKGIEKGFCIECEGRSYALKILYKIKNKLMEKK